MSENKPKPFRRYADFSHLINKDPVVSGVKVKVYDPIKPPSAFVEGEVPPPSAVNPGELLYTVEEMAKDVNHHRPDEFVYKYTRQVSRTFEDATHTLLNGVRDEEDSTNKQIDGKLLRGLRKDRGLTQTDLGNFLGVKKSLVSQWENGRVHVDPKHYYRISKILHVEHGQLSGLQGGSSEEIRDEEEVVVEPGALAIAHQKKHQPAILHGVSDNVDLVEAVIKNYILPAFLSQPALKLNEDAFREMEGRIGPGLMGDLLEHGIIVIQELMPQEEQEQLFDDAEVD